MTPSLCQLCPCACSVLSAHPTSPWQHSSPSPSGSFLSQPLSPVCGLPTSPKARLGARRVAPQTPALACTPLRSGSQPRGPQAAASLLSQPWGSAASRVAASRQLEPLFAFSSSDTWLSIYIYAKVSLLKQLVRFCFLTRPCPRAGRSMSAGNLTPQSLCYLSWEEQSDNLVSILG